MAKKTTRKSVSSGFLDGKMELVVLRCEMQNAKCKMNPNSRNEASNRAAMLENCLTASHKLSPGIARHELPAGASLQKIKRYPLIADTT